MDDLRSTDPTARPSDDVALDTRAWLGRLAPAVVVPPALIAVIDVAVAAPAPASVALAALGASAASLALAWLAIRRPLARLRAERLARTQQLAARATVSQREGVLAAVVERAPTAMVLYGDLGDVVFGNAAARELFAEGATLDGMNFLQLLANAPAPLREAALAEDDALFTIEQGGRPETFRLARRRVTLGGEPHALLLLERMTRELSRQEAARWKRLIRVLCHELNNSLAPVTSLVHSARVIVESPARLDRLGTVLDTIEGRARHLRDFVEGYARFARLPAPRRQRLSWRAFGARFSALYPGIAVTSATDEGPADEGWADEGQLEQAVTNLIKNALESGSATGDVALSIASREHGGARIVVADRGRGMSPEVMEQATLPFFTTKEDGSGLGLPLCREIAEAHGGTLEVALREGGGLEVAITVPGRARADSVAGTARLTLTRG